MVRPAEAAGYSIDEPARWEFDGDLTRRVAVLDHNFTPPRVIRHCGYRLCMKCRDPFFSEDVKGLRLCLPCKGTQPAPLMDEAAKAKQREYNRAYYRARREGWNQ